MTQLRLSHTIDTDSELSATEHQDNLTRIRDVLNGQLEGGATAEGNIVANSIGNRELAPGAVDTAAITNGVVTAAHVATGAVQPAGMLAHYHHAFATGTLDLPFNLPTAVPGMAVTLTGGTPATTGMYLAIGIFDFSWSVDGTANLALGSILANGGTPTSAVAISNSIGRQTAMQAWLLTSMPEGAVVQAYAYKSANNGTVVCFGTHSGLTVIGPL